MVIVTDNDKMTKAVARFFKKRENMRAFCEANGVGWRGVEMAQMDDEVLAALLAPEKTTFETGCVKFLVEGDEGEAFMSDARSGILTGISRRFRDVTGVERFEVLRLREGFDLHARLKLAWNGRREKRE
jgi:hypothetical protein